MSPPDDQALILVQLRVVAALVALDVQIAALDVQDCAEAKNQNKTGENRQKENKLLTFI